MRRYEERMAACLDAIFDQIKASGDRLTENNLIDMFPGISLEIRLLISDLTGQDSKGLHAYHSDISKIVCSRIGWNDSPCH